MDTCLTLRGGVLRSRNPLTISPRNIRLITRRSRGNRKLRRMARFDRRSSVRSYSRRRWHRS
ncbi:hypothetical protein EMCG_04231 [[Emmonsia] crescens]|uniref:Uncharacterized protein n=1 Tax=[Emmonsia] crescens TaxID=73230 RepID=A0A0G2HTR8_9EURO|nr:hypothetical protein EMCG_04231 [Emmonsia crescens UAMH 3008]